MNIAGGAPVGSSTHGRAATAARNGHQQENAIRADAATRAEKAATKTAKGSRRQASGRGGIKETEVIYIRRHRHLGSFGERVLGGACSFEPRLGQGLPGRERVDFRLLRQEYHDTDQGRLRRILPTDGRRRVRAPRRRIVG